MVQNIILNKNMNLLGWRNVVGAFIAAHGGMHVLLWSSPRPDNGSGNFITRGGDIPMLNSLGLGVTSVEAFGTALMLITAAALIVSALLYLSQRRYWERALLASSVLSIVTLLAFWNDWMVMGPIIDLGLIALAYHAWGRSKEVSA